mgnify:CR=1 FL=1
MTGELFPSDIPNWIAGRRQAATNDDLFDKLNPHDAAIFRRAARSRAADVDAAVGRWIGETAGRHLGEVSLELGGKNPLAVCDDAGSENAVKWVPPSSFSNTGQRRAAGSQEPGTEALDIYSDLKDVSSTSTRREWVKEAQTCPPTLP